MRCCYGGLANRPLPGPARRAGGGHGALLGAVGDARILPAATAAVVQDLQVEQLLRVAEGWVVQRAGRGQPGARPVLGRDVIQPAEPPVAAGQGQAAAAAPGAHVHGTHTRVDMHTPPHAAALQALMAAFHPNFTAAGQGPAPRPGWGQSP